MTRLSFEFFPPSTEQGLTRLVDAATRLAAVDPAFFSVTYGAGGSSRHRTFDTIAAVSGCGAPVAAHLTCVGQSVREIGQVMNTYETLGVDRIIALRGDPPEGIDAQYRPHPDGFDRTAHLVAAARPRFDVGVSAYPERHPQSPTFDHDLDVLEAKVRAGAASAITQMCFDDDAFARYLDAVRERHIDVDVVAGIFPIHSFPAVVRFAARCGASIPESVGRLFDGIADDPAATAEVAASFAARQIDRLTALGIDHFHFYTLNQADLPLAVCDRIGVTTGADRSPDDLHERART